MTGLIKEIGRSNSVDISLPDDRKVSRIHARMEKDGDAWVLVDLSSTNGTFVNGQRIEQTKLNSGDEIRIGGTVFLYRAANASSSETEDPTRVDISVSSLSSRFRNILKPRKKK